MKPIITLTTDFGTGSPYVAQMKGVILSIWRDLDLLDVSHAIAPQNIREGAVVLADATPRFPPATIHLAVVDPGVGTARRIIYAEIGEQRYIAPDNGVLSLLTSSEKPRKIIALENADFWAAAPSRTFQGRDIMAPVAAHLARGIDPKGLGPQCASMVMLDWPGPQISASAIVGQVLFVDSFGNLITNIRREQIAPLGEPASITIDCGSRRISGIVPTYGAALVGEMVALFDSQGRLEIAKVGGSAARDLHMEAGEEIIVSS